MTKLVVILLILNLVATVECCTAASETALQTRTTKTVLLDRVTPDVESLQKRVNDLERVCDVKNLTTHLELKCDWDPFWGTWNCKPKEE